MHIRKMNARKRIALVAHDHKKSELVEWSVRNKEALRKHLLYATGTTGTLVENALDQSVVRFMSGPLGGDQQVGSRLAEGKLDILIFFWDPMQAQPHDPDVRALLRLAVVWNVPVACDSATADFILTSPLMQEEYESVLPDYTAYLARTI
ncbi:MAG TPA: methylglyoxal synthase [Chitinophagaceae bacterium]|nr:methylglyoxal synthase [Chitinophagaceae bacterium]